MDTVVLGTSSVVVVVAAERTEVEAWVEPEEGKAKEESSSVGQNLNKGSKRVKSEENWCKH